MSSPARESAVPRRSPLRAVIVAAGMLAAATGLGDEARLPRLSVLPFAARGLERDRAAALEPVLAFELGRLGRYEVVSTADVDAMFGAEKRKDLAGCDDVTCATDIARALAARFVVSPAVARLDDRVVLSLVLIDLDERRVLRRSQVECADDAELWPTALAQAVRKLEPPAPDPELPADGEQRWIARLDALAREDDPCATYDACLAAARARVAEIDRVLAEAAWPPEYLDRRSALERRRGELLRGIEALDLAMLKRGAPATSPADAVAPAGAGGAAAADDPVARAVVELQDLRREGAETRWTWQNRDEKARLERRIAELEAAVESARRRAATALAAGKGGVGARAASPPPSAQELAIEAELRDLRHELETTTWGWENRDRKIAVERRIASLRETLAIIRETKAGVGAK